MNFRCPPLLKLAYELPCQLQIPGVCVGGKGEPAHANWSEFGKGERIKAHDCFFASGCRACHDALDQGSKFSKAQRKHFWLMGYIRTMLLLWSLGFIRVAGVPIGLVTAPQEQHRQNELNRLANRQLDVLRVGNFKMGRKRKKDSPTSRSSKNVPHPASLV